MQLRVATVRAFCRTVFAVLSLLISYCPLAGADAAKVQTTPMMFKAVISGDIQLVKDSLVSVLEGKNYTVINTLNVQQGLKNRGITASPILLVEFINLTKAYQITESNRGFEMFAPLRFALFQDHSSVTVLILRPRFIKSALESGGLSTTASGVLEEFDSDVYQILNTVAAGGF